MIDRLGILMESLNRTHPDMGTIYAPHRVNRYGETETGYLPHLKKALYRHEKTVLGYGIKVWPEDFATLKAKAPETTNLEGLL